LSSRKEKEREREREREKERERENKYVGSLESGREVSVFGRGSRIVVGFSDCQAIALISGLFLISFLFSSPQKNDEIEGDHGNLSESVISLFRFQCPDRSDHIAV
jgi:hypothetical protein